MSKSPTSVAWWRDDAGTLHQRVFAAASFIRSQQSLLRDQMIEHMELYSNGNVSGMGPVLSNASDRFARYMAYGNATPRFNIAACVVDTVWSMVAHTPPVPIYLTTGDDYATMRKAHRRTQVLQGQMNDLARGKIQRAFLDACKVGTGFLWGELEDGLPKLTTVHPLELLVEHADGLYGTPRAVMRVRHAVSKDDLADEYPGWRFEIEQAAESGDMRWTSLFTGAERVEGTCEVIEAIRLGPRGKPGRRVVCVSTAVLEDEPFKDDMLPLAVCPFARRDFGFYGAGLVEVARDAQYRVDDMCRRNARAQELGSTMKLINPNGPGTLKKGELTNEIGEIWEINGAIPVQVVTFQGTLVDLQEQIDLELQRLLFTVGVSESRAAGEGGGKGLTSGVAVRADDDIRQQRMLSPSENYQQFCLDTAKLIERLNDRLAKEDGDYKAKGSARRGQRTFLVTSRWADLAIEPGTADVQMFPMSALPSAPAGKFAMVMEWIEGGMVDRDYGMQMMRFPDLDAFADEKFADQNLVRWQLEQMLDGIPVIPLKRQNQQIAYDLGRRALLKLETQPKSDEAADLVSAYLDHVDVNLAAATPPPVAAPMPGVPALGPGGPAPMPGAPAPAPGPLAQPMASIAGLAPAPL